MSSRLFTSSKPRARLRRRLKPPPPPKTKKIVTGQVIAQIVQRLVDHPSVFFTLLGETLSRVCGFFCDYVIIRAFTGMSMELVRAYNVFPEVLGMLTRRKQWARSLYQFMVEVRACFSVVLSVY